MSRTYKDRPKWVQLNDPKSHRVAEHWHVSGHKCDLDIPATSNNKGFAGACHYSLPYHVCYQNPTKEQRRIMFWQKLRQEERSTLYQAKQQYNTSSETDEDIIITNRHNHDIYGEGYWD